ncbi:MAG: PilZ domain-containing protein [Treponema sp.]|nr:PilZ domain-containing protein [Treponema sp.]
MPLLDIVKRFFHLKDSGQGKGADKSGENRRYTRYRSLARVKFPDRVGEECLLKDISVTGCRVECSSLMDLKANALYILEVIPEAAAKIGKFNLEVSSIWIRPGDYSSDAGFSIVASPKGKLFQRYVDYLAWRDNHPGRVAKAD